MPVPTPPIQTVPLHPGHRGDTPAAPRQPVVDAVVPPHPAANPPPDRPRIVLSKQRDLPALTAAAWAALQQANDPPSLFTFADRPVRLVCNAEGTCSLEPLTEDRLRHVVVRAAKWVKVAYETEEAAEPPPGVIADMLACPEYPLPRLRRIVSAPVFAATGVLQTAPGYHPASGTWYAAEAGITLSAVSPAPTTSEVQVARRLLLEDLLGDFPIVSDSDRAHAVSLLLLPFVRELIDGPTPLHCIEKPTIGTGATLLAEMLLYPALGKAFAVMPAPTTETEWQKQVVASLRDAPAAVVIDNISTRVTSTALASVLTASTFRGRLLGTSEQVGLPVQCAWVATGNNPVWSAELQRRLVRIRLDAGTEHPHLRDAQSFRHPNLRHWVATHRGDLVWAALTLVQAWVDRGQPKGTVTRASYEAWAQVLGGILQVAGISGFLGDRNAVLAVPDEQETSLASLLFAWWEDYQSMPFGAEQLYTLVPQHAPALDLGDNGERAQRIRLGQLLGRARDRRFGPFCLVASGLRHGAQLWTLRAEQPVHPGAGADIRRTSPDVR
jgi:putative DNA primase/helicase